MRLDSPRALTLRYLLVLLFIALLSLAAYLTLIYGLVTGRSHAAFINLSAAQGTHAQRIAFFSSMMVTASSPEERTECRRQLKVGIDEMARNEEALIHGDPALLLPP